MTVVATRNFSVNFLLFVWSTLTNASLHTPDSEPCMTWNLFWKKHWRAPSISSLKWGVSGWLIGSFLVQYFSLFRQGKSRSCSLLMVACPYTISGGIAFYFIHILAFAQDRKMCRCSADLCSAALLWLKLIALRPLVSSLAIRRCSGIIVMGPVRYGRLVWPPVTVTVRITGMRGHCCVPVQRGCCSLIHSLFIPLCLFSILYLLCQQAPRYTSPQTSPLENKTKEENIFSANDAHTLFVFESTPV